MSEIQIRQGGPDDHDALLQMFDDAVAWLSARGNGAQWGTVPWSMLAGRIQQVRLMVGNPGIRVAEIDGEPAGVLVVDEETFGHVPAVDERELFVRLLITSRKFAGRGVGSKLISYALEEASRRGISLVRVDCWAGGKGDLVRYYESQGFERTVQFDVLGWVGQVLEQRVAAAEGAPAVDAD
jgi:GNAT superfamily N-acetyltransferase